MRGVKRKRTRKRKEEELRAAVGAFMHLTGVYTPALHMSSFLSFKSSLQEDRTQRHKHKIVKEPQTQSEGTDVSFNASSSAKSLTHTDLIKGQLGANVSAWSQLSRTQNLWLTAGRGPAHIRSFSANCLFYPKIADCLLSHHHLLPLKLNDSHGCLSMKMLLPASRSPG